MLRLHTPYLLALVLLTLVVPGCGKKRALPQFAVSGTVLVNGKPADRAKVFFTPVTSSKNPTRTVAITDAEGVFRLTPDAGIRAGDYYVTIIWPGYRSGGDEEVETGDRLKGQYADIGNPVAQVKIADGDNQLTPFNLKE